MISAPIPDLKCGVCLGPVTDDDCTHNYSDHPHDGYWCGDCLHAYSLPRADAVALLEARIHPQSWLEVTR